MRLRRRRTHQLTPDKLRDLAFDNRLQIEFGDDTGFIKLDGVTFYATLPAAEGATS